MSDDNGNNAAWGSDIVNGQLVTRAPASAFFPLVLSPMYTGPGYWPRQGSYQVPPVVPSAASSMSPGAVGTSTVPTQTDSTGNPWHPTKGTILFGFGALVLGLFMLRYIHW